MIFIECPCCQNDIKLGHRPHMGQQIRCRFCDAPLEVVWLNPVELDWGEDEDNQKEYDRDFDDNYEDVDELEEYEGAIASETFVERSDS